MVILLDDDETFRTALAECLHDDGHEVHAYASPSEVPLLTAIGPVAAVIMEYQMSHEDGLSFARRFHAAHPTVPLLMATGYRTTGYSTDHLEREVAAHKYLSLLWKPFDYDELHILLHHLTTRRRR